MGKLILVTGGARSGKSSFAEKYVAKYGKNIAYIATSQVLDEEMAYRVKLHRERRPENWQTFEAPKDAHAAISEAGKTCDMILFDCLTVYISNILCGMDNLEDEELLFQTVKQQYELLLLAVGETEATVVIVTNEVGAGIVPMNKLARHFRDLAGLANQAMAKEATEVYLVVSGMAVNVKKLAENL